MLWLVTMVRSCVVFEGFGSDAARVVYSGTLSPAFSIEGLWVWAWSPPGPEVSTGETHWVEMQVELDATGEPIIQVQGLDIAPRIESEPFTFTMERFSTTTEFNPFP
jgi:hypothetical protein